MRWHLNRQPMGDVDQVLLPGSKLNFTITNTINSTFTNCESPSTSSTSPPTLPLPPPSPSPPPPPSLPSSSQGQSRAKWTAQMASVRLDSRAPWEQVILIAYLVVFFILTSYHGGNLQYYCHVKYLILAYLVVFLILTSYLGSRLDYCHVKEDFHATHILY